MNPEASDLMMEADYQLTLMAIDHSRSAVMNHIMNDLSGDIEKEIK
jgi:hypothetical protein